MPPRSTQEGQAVQAVQAMCLMVMVELVEQLLHLRELPLVSLVLEEVGELPLCFLRIGFLELGRSLEVGGRRYFVQVIPVATAASEEARSRVGFLPLY